MREGELFGLALEDFDFDERIVRVRRQIKKIGRIFVFALPKNGRERIVPLSDWDVEVIRRQVNRHPPRPYSLPWESRTGNRILGAGGVSIKELAEHLGHADPAFTLRVYAHLLPSSHDRARTVINDRFGRLMHDPGNRVHAHGTETEQA
jgi:integrase